MKNDPDGGDGYTNRVITLAALFLAGVTAVLVLAAPLLMRLFLSSSYFTPELAAQRESVIDFARYCLPQVFFYGMFVLVGQVLNAARQLRPDDVGADRQQRDLGRGARRLPAVFGRADDLCRGGSPASVTDSVLGPFSSGQEPLLGLGLHARDRGPAADPAAVPAQGRLPVPPAVRLPRHRARAHAPARHLDRAVRDRQPDRLHGRGADRLQRYGGRRRLVRPAGRDRLHDLLQRVPAGDGAALDRHGLAGDRDAAAALGVRRRPRPGRRSAAVSARRCARPTR